MTLIFLHSLILIPPSCLLSFFFNHTATTEIYTLSLHDALPICSWRAAPLPNFHISPKPRRTSVVQRRGAPKDRKSTRLNSSHRCISYAVFCLKKKTEASS